MTVAIRPGPAVTGLAQWVLHRRLFGIMEARTKVVLCRSAVTLRRTDNLRG